MHQIIYAVNKLLLVSGAITVAISVGYLAVLAFLGAGSKRIVYPVVFSTLTEDLWWAGVLAFFAIGIAFFVIAQVSAFLGAIKKEKYDASTGAKGVFLAFVAVMLPFVVFLMLWFAPGQFRSPFGQWQEVRNTDLTNRKFHLTYYTPDATEGVFDYFLYECDSMDFLCQEIYNESAFTLSVTVGNYALDAPIILIDPATNTIALQINGETVYTHRVE